jgi:hypothetical protein
LISGVDCITLIRQKNGGYALSSQDQQGLRNNLLAGVGFLELANAGDFAANVWNEVPVPRYAVVLMALGGTLALSLSFFAFKDAVLSRQNIRRLRTERRYLRSQTADKICDQHSGTQPMVARDLDAYLDVNFRELGTELIDRIGMDIVMGFGAVLVSIGTFMAIGGSNPDVFLASNLLSGYVGNAPVAFFGTVNAGWSVYVWLRARRHGRACAREFSINDHAGAETETDAVNVVKAALRNRLRTVMMHAATNGVTGVTAGTASLVTATIWYGYPVLALCILSSVLCNYIWRHEIGYDRPLARQRVQFNKDSLMEDLKSVTAAMRALDGEKASRDEPAPRLLPKLVQHYESMAAVVEFLVRNDLFEDFCVRLVRDTALPESLFGPLNDNKELLIEPLVLLNADKIYVSRYLEIVEATVREMAATRLRYRERYLLETLGCYLCSLGVELASEKC